MPTRPSTLADPVGAVDVLARLQAGGVDITRAAVNRWHAQRATTGYPAPRRTVSGNPAWEWADVVAWLERTGRPVPG